MPGSEKRNKLVLTIEYWIISSVALLVIACSRPGELETKPQGRFSAIISCPTGSSIKINLLSDFDSELYLEYGKSPGSLDQAGNITLVSKNVPGKTAIENLEAGMKYYYRARYRAKGSGDEFLAGLICTFKTAQSSSGTFSFAIEADPHLDVNSDTAAFALTLKNIAAANPDFLIDLGDTFMSEKLPLPVAQEDITDRHLLLRSYFERICHSIPLYLVLGNHEGELGWRKDGSAGCLPVLAANTRTLYFSNPVPDNFYSGNVLSETNVELRQNYYSWEWGSALFIVIDPFWYSTVKNGWGFSLGKDQYDWFKNVLASSRAKYRFVFSHNLVGGNGNDMRGGAEFVHLFEMGGDNSDGSWGFDANRPGWGKPIHTIMKEHNVTAFFHGHDHFYGKQEKDGIIYQEVPQPSNRSITNISASEYGYVDGTLLPGRGYLLVTVSENNVKVEYIGTFLPGEENATKKNGTFIDTYIIN